MCDDCRRYRERHKRQPRVHEPDEVLGDGEALYRAMRRQTFPAQADEVEQSEEAEREEQHQ